MCDLVGQGGCPGQEFAPPEGERLEDLPVRGVADSDEGVAFVAASASLAKRDVLPGAAVDPG